MAKLKVHTETNCKGTVQLNLGHFLDRAAEKHPQKPAVICDGKKVTYGELKTRTEALAASLYRLGITKGTRVGIISCNSIYYIEIIFALMKLGAVCVPFNYRLTAVEIKELAEHSDITTLFYEELLHEKVPFTIPAIKNYITIGNRKEKTSDTILYDILVAHDAMEYPSIEINETDESFVIYTAGTTGRPKGVVLTHGNNISNTENYTSALGMVSHNIELAPTQLFHSSTLGRIFTYVCNCMTFIICSNFDAEACLDIIQHEKVTSLTQAPTMYTMMLNSIKSGTWDTRSVKRAVTGASPITPKTREGLKELFPQAAFFDIYGLTEASPGVTVLDASDFFSKTVSVGKPMKNVRTVIADENGNPLPAGRIGEILCHGPNIMKGYYKDPDQTAAAVSNGWLHTGDMGKMDEDGFLYITGRKKEIIISGGTNIFPGEIEKVLLMHPAVDDAAVIGVADDIWGEKVAAVVILKWQKQCTQESLMNFCRQHLAGYKCPRVIFFAETLPRNAAQKIMKNKLQMIYNEF